MKRLLPLLVGCVLLVSAAVVHGLWTDRWHLSDEPKASADRLQHVADSLGDWEGQTPVTLDAQSLAIGEIAGYLDRFYVNARTGQKLSVLAVCGRPGPIGQHPPDVCFGGQGFELVNKVHQTIQIEGLPAPAEFWVGHFRRSEAGGSVHLRIYWSWSPNGKWTAPGSPRLSFARFPALYKIYVVHRMSGEDEPAEEDPSPGFIKLLLPEFQRTLFTPGQQAEVASGTSGADKP